MTNDQFYQCSNLPTYRLGVALSAKSGTMRGGGEVTLNSAVNQLVIVTVSDAQAGALTDRLIRDGFRVTQVASSGGILYEAAVSLLIGLDRARLPRLLEHIRACCRTRRRFIPAHVEAPLLEIQPVVIEAEVGGATVYVLDVERFEQL
jgi:uncharacterized protein YaaQ